jgi:hypothetical protein
MLAARSIQEARLYVDLHPCGCGTTSGFEPGFALEERDGQQLAVYTGRCPGCGHERRFEFTMQPPVVDGYGGPEPSRIVDPGEFLWVSDNATDRALSLTDLTDGPDRQAARTSFDIAVAALDEVLKFVGAGAAEVPADQIRSELGRTVYDANSDRFQVDRLRQRRAMLVDAQARLERAAGAEESAGQKS